MAYAGIDYGMGTSNVDLKTGIRYGVISQGSVGDAWYEDAEPDYGEPTCPKCGNPARDCRTLDEVPDWEFAKGESCEYACLNCEYLFGSDSAYGEEPNGYNYQDSEYTLTDCLVSDIFVLKSPYYTYAQFCSPCVPGAGNLDSPLDKGEGAKCYCLDKSWFEDDKAPYPVYRVSDDSLVTE